MKTQLEYYTATKTELDSFFKNIKNYSGVSFKDIFGPKPSSKAHKSGLGTWYIHFEVSDKEQYNQLINQSNHPLADS
ncbi:hypothetical protein OAN60_01925 [Flavobacteriaceae bacterium]|jgi:hypothetical protein|nr:hypothetical protein [Flavobacteriaceae bacterium]MDC3216036.1 hypothetical protein [Flavobacteriaceae bacterium]MDC3334562.1 hypothetical protein [Flavobacteriaceae bacterium]